MGGALGALSAANAGEQVLRVTDSAGRPLPDAVGYAIPDVPFRVRGRTLATIDQVNKQFVPRISVVQTGTEIEFPNSDNIRHSVYSFSEPKPFTLKLYAGKPAAPLPFDKPGVVVLGCNIHDRMAAWLVIVDTPYFGRTDPQGVLRLRDLPAGHYRLVAWYPTLPDEGVGRDVTIGAAASPVQEYPLPVTPIDGP